MLKIKGIIIATIICLLLCQAGFAEGTQPAKSTGIISAMQNEIDLLLATAEIDHTDTVGGVDYHVGTLCGEPVVIAKAGVGKILSAAGMTAMLNNYDISRVLFTGIAGGVGDETRVLDVVIATELVQHDFGNLNNDGFVWCGGFSASQVTIPATGNSSKWPTARRWLSSERATSSGDSSPPGISSWRLRRSSGGSRRNSTPSPARWRARPLPSYVSSTTRLLW